MIPMNPDPWATGVLNPEAHGRLVQRREEYAADAGIPAPFIWTPIAAVLPTEEERLWVRKFKYHRSLGYSGLVYLGAGFDPTVEVRMCGIAGALTRNFIRARVMSMETVYQFMRVGESPEATCLLLPTFSDTKAEDRRASMVSDLLIERWNSGRGQTVVCAPSWDHLTKVYGSFLRDHLKSHYKEIRGAK